MILPLLKNELKRLFVTPLAWVILGIGQLIIAWVFFTELEVYETIQSHLAATESPLGITALVLVPAMLNGLNIIMLITPLLTMRSIAGERQNQRFNLLLASPATAGQILTAKFLAIFSLLGLFWLLNLFQAIALNFGTQPDHGKLLLTWLAGLFVIATYISVGLWLSSLTRHPVIAAISTYGMLIFLRISGSADQTGFLDWFALTQHLQAARHGLFNSSDLIYFLLLIGLFLILAWTRLLQFRSLQSRGAARLTVILLLLAVSLSWPVLQKYQYSHDFSHSQQNTLSVATQELLQELDQPLSMTVYVSNNPVLKKQITHVLSRFKRSLPDLVIQYIDPQQQPQAARVLGITRNGEILVRYNERQQLVKKLDEAEISKTIMHLSQRNQGWILNLQGHDEMDLLGNGLYGAATLSKNLQARGYQVRNYNLSQFGQLPVNTDLIIIGGAKGALTEIEKIALNSYLEKGGNLLWLADPGTDMKTTGLEALPAINWLPGVIVDATAAKLKLATPDNAVITNYPEHAVIADISQHTLFPQATALEVIPNSNWQQVLKLQTGSLSWNETGSLKGEIDRDPLLFEQQGPLTVATLLQRSVNERTQKIAFFGDSDFLRNQMLGQGDNLQLTLNLFYWLTHSDNAADKTIIRPLDQTVELTNTGRAIFGIFFLFLLPLIFIVSGFIIPWQRKRRQ